MEQNCSNFRGHSLPPGSADSRPMLRHRRYDACLAPPGREVLRQNYGRRLLPRHAATGQPESRTTLRWIEADALRLPFPDNHFDLITSAFGFRNLADYDAGLQEIMRVLRPGGEFGILDFGEPKGLVGSCYRIYFKHVLPAIGTLDLRSKRPVRIFAGIGRPLSRSRRDAAAHATHRLSKSVLDPVHPGHRRPIPRKEITVYVAPASRRLSRGRPALATTAPPI